MKAELQQFIDRSACEFEQDGQYVRAAERMPWHEFEFAARSANDCKDRATCSSGTIPSWCI
jgi:hypothetical protein